MEAVKIPQAFMELWPLSSYSKEAMQLESPHSQCFIHPRYSTIRFEVMEWQPGLSQSHAAGKFFLISTYSCAFLTEGMNSLFSVFVWPFALAAIGWKTYMINAGWDAIQFAFVAYFWIETKGLTLEEINAKFDALHERDTRGTEGLNRSSMILEGVAKTTSIDAASSVKLQKDGSRVASQNI